VNPVEDVAIEMDRLQQQNRNLLDQLQGEQSLFSRVRELTAKIAEIQTLNDRNKSNLQSLLESQGRTITGLEEQNAELTAEVHRLKSENERLQQRVAVPIVQAVASEPDPGFPALVSQFAILQDSLIACIDLYRGLAAIPDWPNADARAADDLLRRAAWRVEWPLLHWCAERTKEIGEFNDHLRDPDKGKQWIAMQIRDKWSPPNIAKKTQELDAALLSVREESGKKLAAVHATLGEFRAALGRYDVDRRVDFRRVRADVLGTVALLREELMAVRAVIEDVPSSILALRNSEPVTRNRITPRHPIFQFCAKLNAMANPTI
jgi:hypothetical protein